MIILLSFHIFTNLFFISDLIWIMDLKKNMKINQNLICVVEIFDC